MSVSCHHEDFSSYVWLASDTVTTANPTRPYWDKCIYKIHRSGENLGVYNGAGVYEISGLCPPFCASNSNMFASTFGVEYEADGVALIRPISDYEISCWFHINRDLTYSIAHPEMFYLLDCGIPLRISGVLLDAILKQLEKSALINLKYSTPLATLPLQPYCKCQLKITVLLDQGLLIKKHGINL